MMENSWSIAVESAAALGVHCQKAGPPVTEGSVSGKVVELLDELKPGSPVSRGVGADGAVAELLIRLEVRTGNVGC